MIVHWPFSFQIGVSLYPFKSVSIIQIGLHLFKLLVNENLIFLFQAPRPHPDPRDVGASWEAGHHWPGAQSIALNIPKCNDLWIICMIWVFFWVVLRRLDTMPTFLYSNAKPSFWSQFRAQLLWAVLTFALAGGTPIDTGETWNLTTSEFNL